MAFVREELQTQTAFTNYNFALNLCLVAQIQTYLTLSGNLNSKNDFSELVLKLEDHVKFLYDDNQIEELYFLSRGSKYLGATNLGNRQLWKYLKTRFSRLSSAATSEQMLQFIEGVKRRGESLSSYGKLLELVNDMSANFEKYDFGIKTYAFEVSLLLQKDGEIQINKEFEKKYCREFEQTDIQSIDNILTLKKLKFVCKSVKRLDVYVKDVDQVLSEKIGGN